MKAFLSHSSRDKDFVLQVYDALEPSSVWLDRAEIEWGQLFLDKISEGVRVATDFVLFWSQASAQSEWVNLEINMAFMQLLHRRAIRLRIIKLDETALPLHLEPFHHVALAHSENPVADAISALKSALSQPTQGVRHRFLNRNTEFERIEDLVNDAETKVIFLRGFQGIGKGSLAKESLRRFFEGASEVEIDVRPGVGVTELALRLHHEAFNRVLPEVSGIQALAAIEAAMQAIIARGQFLIFRNVQHWLDGERNLEEPLPTIVAQSVASYETSLRPIFLTSTRNPRIPVDWARSVSTVQVNGLADDHTASLIALWYDLSEGKALDQAQASKEHLNN